MAVRKADRKESRLEVIIKAEELAAYTLEICSNPKSFDPSQISLTARICSLAVEIYEELYAANCVRVTDSETLSLRLSEQYKAMISCSVLIADIQLCRPVFHLSSKRIAYWSKMTKSVQDLARKWRDSDASRFKHI